MSRWCPLLVLLLVHAAGAALTCDVGPDGLRVRLTAGDEGLVLGPELFGLTLADGKQLTARDLTPTAPPRLRERELTATFRGHDTTVGYRLWQEPDESWWRVRLEVAAPQPVVRCDIVRLQAPPKPELGGFGQPWYLGGSWFAGVEYPASRQLLDGTVATCSHTPGLASFTSKTAVIGHRGSEARVADAFGGYLLRVARPRRSYLQYNSWYDWRGKEMTVEHLARTFHEFQAALLQPYGLHFDAFVPDDGWQQPDSIWEVNRAILPQEFAPLSRILMAGGSRLGLWLPVNGTNLNVRWGKMIGIEPSEVSDRHYSLRDPAYAKAIRQALQHRITDGKLAYFKHDFNDWRTYQHPPLGADVDFEQTLDTQLELHRYERELARDIYLNITSGVWLSPWWLVHADAIWMAANDFGYEKSYPVPSPRDWDLSYRDQHFYGKYVVERSQCPLSRLMTHGIIDARYNRLGGQDETLREWSDSVVMYYGRGVQLKELYLTPSLLNAEMWRVLGRATQWAERHGETFDHTVYLGGQPRLGQVYGYVHWGRGEGVVVVRNPAPRDGSLKLTLAERPARMGERGSWRLTRVYPDFGALPATLTGDGAVDLPAPGQSVLVYELAPATDAPPLVTPLPPADGTAALDATGKLAIQAHVGPSAGEAELQVVVRGAQPKLQLDAGQPARTLRGVDSVLWTVPLKPGDTTLGARFDQAADLFAGQAGTLSVWLRCTGTTAPRPDREAQLVSMPPRLTRALLEDQPLPTPKRAGIADEDLPRVTAVRVRLELFDSNGEPPYNTKRILLNGREVAPVPASPSDRFSAWHEVIIELTPAQAGELRRANELAFTNPGGDSWKVRGLALAVRRPDGVWVATPVDAGVQSSGGVGWLYHEGTEFGAKSAPVTVTLPRP